MKKVIFIVFTIIPVFVYGNWVEWKKEKILDLDDLFHGDSLSFYTPGSIFRMNIGEDGDTNNIQMVTVQIMVYNLPFHSWLRYHYYKEGSIETKVVDSTFGFYNFSSDTDSRGRLHLLYSFLPPDTPSYTLVYGVIHGDTVFSLDTIFKEENKRDYYWRYQGKNTILLDKDDNPHIIYLTISEEPGGMYYSETLYVHHRYFTGSEWQDEIIYEAMEETENPAMLAEISPGITSIDADFDSEDNLYIAFLEDSIVDENDYDNWNFFFYGKLLYEDGGVWKTERLPGDYFYNTGYDRNFLQMEIDRNDNIHIAWKERLCRYPDNPSLYNTTWYGERNKGENDWRIKKLDEKSDFVYDNLFLSLDTSDVPHLFVSVTWGGYSPGGYGKHYWKYDNDTWKMERCPLVNSDVVFDMNNRPHYLSLDTMTLREIYHVWRQEHEGIREKDRGNRDRIRITEKKGCIEIEMGYNGYAEIKMYDIHGRKIDDIYSGYVDGNKKIIYDWKELPGGVYFIRVKLNSREVMQKLIKRR